MKDVNLDYLKKAYFPYDLPVPFELKDGNTIMVKPVSLVDSEAFLSSMGVLIIDKNSIPDPKVISMSYLEFLLCRLIMNQSIKEEERTTYYDRLLVILKLCLGINRFQVRWKNNKPYLHDLDKRFDIVAKDFDNIIKIIMYQNLVNYDDEYVNPDLKKAMEETDALRNKDIESPGIERRIAIITSHCGLPKKEQLQMTYRSHDVLFREVCGEVEFATTRNAKMITQSMSTKKSKLDIEHWIFKKKKGKFDGYIKSVDDYMASMGGNSSIKTTDTSQGDAYLEQFNNFKQK